MATTDKSYFLSQILQMQQVNEITYHKIPMHFNNMCQFQLWVQWGRGLPGMVGFFCAWAFYVGTHPECFHELEISTGIIVKFITNLIYLSHWKYICQNEIIWDSFSKCFIQTTLIQTCSLLSLINYVQFYLWFMYWCLVFTWRNYTPGVILQTNVFPGTM